jgi:peptidoglycan/xylan/chitin deacetylase (PgdA/CDA1 family)
MVSFSFDDFPKSALAAGGAILERHGARGVYYTAAGLQGGDSELGPLFDLEDLRQARSAGHEIGCHTYSHIDCAASTPAALLEEIRLNATVLARVLDGKGPSNFAFPFGAASPEARRTLRPRFSTCRGIGPGLNTSAGDLAELKANRIYHRDYDLTRLCALVDQACATGSWAIFYTHDVADTPSPYGCSPAQFEAIVAYAAASCPILPVGQALRRAVRAR